MGKGGGMTPVKSVKKPKKMFPCNICGKVCKRFADLNEHVRVHTGERPFNCSRCNKSFKTSSNRTKHLRTHSRRLKPWICAFCDKGFPTRHQLESHIHTHLEERAYECQKCDKSFKTHVHLASHNKTHENARLHLCPFCGSRFNTNNKLNEHIQRHIREKPFACHLCSKDFVTSYERNNHLLSHNKEGTTPKRFDCTICGKAFQTNGKLNRHIIVHTGERHYKCHVCQKAFQTQSQLTRHINSVHLNLKTIYCLFCDKSFPNDGNLYRHIRGHLGEKPYDCKVCGKDFKSSTELAQHLKTHDGTKSFWCPLCGDGFKSQQGLYLHIGRHTKERPYSCDVCSQDFVTSADWRRHVCGDAKVKKGVGSNNYSQDGRGKTGNVKNEEGIKCLQPPCDTELIAIDDSSAETVVNMEEQSSCCADEQEFGDLLFEEEHGAVKLEAETLPEDAEGETHKTSHSLNFPVSILEFQEDGSRNARAPEGLLLVEVEGASIKVSWTRCLRTNDAFLGCTLMNCNYSLCLGTTSDEMNAAYKRIEEHIQQNHKVQADQLAQRVGKQQHFRCPYHPLCNLEFADLGSCEIHEDLHLTCFRCGKTFRKNSPFYRNAAALLHHKCNKKTQQMKRNARTGSGGEGAPGYNKKTKSSF